MPTKIKPVTELFDWDFRIWLEFSKLFSISIKYYCLSGGDLSNWRRGVIRTPLFLYPTITKHPIISSLCLNRPAYVWQANTYKEKKPHFLLVWRHLKRFFLRKIPYFKQNPPTPTERFIGCPVGLYEDNFSEDMKSLLLPSNCSWRGGCPWQYHSFPKQVGIKRFLLVYIPFHRKISGIWKCSSFHCKVWSKMIAYCNAMREQVRSPHGEAFAFYIGFASP